MRRSLPLPRGNWPSGSAANHRGRAARANSLVRTGQQSGRIAPADNEQLAIRSALADRLARRKAMPLAEIERWLAPNLGYDPG